MRYRELIVTAPDLGESISGAILAGVMVLSKAHPQTILYRLPEPVLTPASEEELRGTIANVVFPTGIDRRDDLGTPDRFDIYYGMADSRIGVARLDLPEQLPAGAAADQPEAKSNAPNFEKPKL